MKCDIRFDFCPDDMTPGERAAIADASPAGWIVPPLYDSLEPEGVRAWRTVHLRYLERRHLIAKSERRADGLFCYLLNAAGIALRDELHASLAQHWIFATGDKDFGVDCGDRRFMVLS